MAEKSKLVSNPLTVVAIFAGLAEVSGTGILPFINDDTQGTYVWFLMLFPTFLVVLFFGTLNCNSKVLYAPSDFKDEENYMKMFKPISPAELARKKEQGIDEVAKLEAGGEAQEGDVDLVSTETGDRSKESGGSHAIISEKAIATKAELDALLKSPKSFYAFTEALVIDRLTKEFRSPVLREVRFGGDRFSPIFDAVFETEKGIVVVETKAFRFRPLRKTINDLVSQVERAVLSLPMEVRKKSRVVVAVAHDMSEEDEMRFKTEFEALARLALTPMELRAYSLQNLVDDAEKK